MARGHGRILTPIWEDADFLALTQHEQRLYLFLISQPNLNHAGLLPMTLRRWARKSSDLTAVELEKHLLALATARFIVMDEDTEELLIRSFVRNDGVWKQPKVMGAMVSGAMEISSPLLRRALLDEMNRVPLDELSDEPMKVRGIEGPSIRQQVADHIGALRKAFGNPHPDPTRGGYAPPSDTPSAPPSEGTCETHAEEAPTPSTRAGAGAHDARAPLPLSPATVPSHGTEGGGEAVEQAEAAAGLAQSGSYDPAPIDLDGFALTDPMRRWAVSTFGGALNIEYETDQFVSHFRADGGRRRNWPEEWKKWLRRSAKFESGRQQNSGGNVVAIRASGRPLPGTDTTVAGWDALAAELRAKENPA
ncbi:hypothetical protein OG552_10305 [Streptomyces sp. NBC_01476]|uniref:hypothetical protein n=1 Tax=Streptomyces sp. NBC_01476 TaxID=2903881 RepID=UPI002E3193AD|nr:hypothetical protein [Streptomyces sp. NBC_01476]